MAKWKNGSQAASLIRNIVENFQQSGNDFIPKKPEMQSNQKQNASTEGNVLRKISKEEHLSRTYRHYLDSTMRLEALQEQYKGGERSLEESAKLVGLKMPASKP
uniref:Protein FMC1 homolog n=1 Tax=Setaria digitata TaxID=48799 RepID=A0A915PQ17_9BILA